MIHYKNARVVVFNSLAEAMASNYVLGYGDIAVIKNDRSRFKVGIGIKISSSQPAKVAGTAPMGNTFSQLPWVNTSANVGNALNVPATATLTAAQLLQRYLSTSSAAATTITLPNAADLTAALNLTTAGSARGSELEFEVDNATGANTVTVAVGAGTTVGAGALTGSNTLTVPAGQFAKFRLFFINTTTALLYRTL